jgi:hypothetical protein
MGDQDHSIDGKYPSEDSMDCPSPYSDSSFPLSERQKSRSMKLVEFYKAIVPLENEISTILEDNGVWKSSVEGHTLWFPEKIKLMQDLADDPRISTICEIGFNAGYSSLNFLISNSNAKLITFDIFSRLYSTAAIRGLQKLFPDRFIGKLSRLFTFCLISLFIASNVLLI